LFCFLEVVNTEKRLDKFRRAETLLQTVRETIEKMSGKNDSAKGSARRGC
jgi:hypothetical protein